LHLRAQVDKSAAERATMRALARVLGDARLYERAQRLGRLGGGLAQAVPGPLARWTQTRELRPVAKETFREWWRRERGA
jgi:L-lactate dehydrogenase complex protein LldF